MAKIPEMFLKAMKRKAEVVTDATNMMPVKQMLLEEKTKVEEPKQITTPKQNVAERFSLYSLLTNPSWKELLNSEFDKGYMKKIESFLDNEYKRNMQIFPPKNEIFTAFNTTDLQDIKVVIIGQDPYHDDNQAHGLSFSVKLGVRPPPSLKNIYKELCEDIPSFKTPDHGYLLGWARQGVFMLNATLTVEAHKANSHAKIGWQTFTDQVIRLISKNAKNVVFLLWGGFAHKKEILIDEKKHAIIKTAHPSPLSARHWTGCKCFSQANKKLESFRRPAIDWSDLKRSY